MDSLTNAEVTNNWSADGGQYAYLSRIEVNPLSPEVPVTSICFDPYEELLWCGNLNGRVASFHGISAFEKYTAFVACSSDIRAMEATESVIISLSENQLRANTRHGLPSFHYTSLDMINMCCMYRMTTAPTLLLGGDQQKLIQFDYEKRKELRVAPIQEKNATVIRGNGSFIFTADTDGNVAMRSMCTLETLKLIPKTHGGPITDFDISGHTLITCGCSYRMNSLHGDPYVKVYDLRSFQPQKPLALAFAPVFTRFLPKFDDSRVVLVSQMGQAQFTDTIERGIGTPLIVESDGYALTSFDVSSTSQLLAFGDECGNIHVYADRHNPLINEGSFDTEFADPSLGPPHSFTIEDSQTSLATVPLPFSTDDTYLSDWPGELCQPQIRKQKPMGPYPQINNIQFVGYAPNPRCHTPFRYFNIVPYVLDYNQPEVEDVLPEPPQLIPTFYRPLLLKQSRVDCSLFVKYNKTSLVPLETTNASVSVNPLVYVFYKVPTLRNIFTGHVCDGEHCITCQMGFLFRMLSDMPSSRTATCTNLIRSLAAVGASSLKGDISSSVLKLLVFFMNSLEKELSSDEKEGLYEVLQTELLVNSRCIRCGEINVGVETSNYLTIRYPVAAEHLTMCSLIEKALHFRGQCERECMPCSSKTRMEETRRVKRLPPVLLVDTNRTDVKFLNFWRDQLKLTERRPRYREPDAECSFFPGMKGERLCRYGTDCRNRPHCKYSHGSSDWDAECSTWLSDTGGEWRHFVAQSFAARISNGIAILTEQSSDPGTEIYDLVAMVVAINDENDKWSHVVTLMKQQKKENSWCVVNDGLITEVHGDEAVHFDSSWKLPVALLYASRTRGAMSAVEVRKAISTSVFHTDSNLTGNEEIAKLRRERDLPTKGMVVGIDAEFINMTKDHNRKSVGRVSCVDSTGEHIIIDDYVVTCEGDVVDDYLTPFSGIMEEDLNPFKSTKHLTTLKTVYMKILYLIEKGVIFVGHALNNDFSVLNIYVPPEQMHDTVQLFHLPQQRMLSLQFLAWHLLGELIQQTVHDSVEDARIALKLHEKWTSLRDDGSLNDVVNQLYETGKSQNWRLTKSPIKSPSPTDPEKF